MPSHVVITGANRGLGLEFCRQELGRGSKVFALCRNPEEAEELNALGGEYPDRLHIAACDVACDDGVAAAAEKIAAAFPQVDLLINNAGTFGDREADFETLEFDDIVDTMQTNTFGPLRMVRSLLQPLSRGTRPKVVNVTSLMGSAGDNSSGGSWPYRISKGALNMVSRNLAYELAPEGITVIAIHPGWVQTRMGGSRAPLTIPESVSAMLGTIDGLHPEQSGGFVDRNGKRQPW